MLNNVFALFSIQMTVSELLAAALALSLDHKLTQLMVIECSRSKIILYDSNLATQSC